MGCNKKVRSSPTKTGSQTALPLPIDFGEQSQTASRPAFSAQAPAELLAPLARSHDPAAPFLLLGPSAAAQPGAGGAIEPARSLPRLPRPWCPSPRPGPEETDVSRWLPASPARSARRILPASARLPARSPAHSGTQPDLDSWSAPSQDRLKGLGGAGAGRGLRRHRVLPGPSSCTAPCRFPRVRPSR